MLLIYKIVPRALWLEAEETGTFAGAPVDLADGFIHLSAAEQVEETARRHFAGQSDPLPVAAATWAKPLPLGHDGHAFGTMLEPN